MRKSLIRFYRSVTVIFLFILFGCGALFERYFIFPFQSGKNQNYNTLHKSWKFFINLMQKLKIIKLSVDNMPKIEGIKNSIIVSTHPSFIDVLILMSIIPNSTCFVAKRLADNPFLKGMVKLLFILENQTVEEMINETKEKLDEGLNVIIFPMGIRHRKHETPKIRRGTALIAQKMKKNIVLLDMETSFDFLQINQPIYDAGEEAVEYKLQYLGEIDIKNYLDKYSDEVTFNTIITRQIGKILYNI